MEKLEPEETDDFLWDFSGDSSVLYGSKLYPLNGEDEFLNFEFGLLKNFFKLNSLRPGDEDMLLDSFKGDMMRSLFAFLNIL